MDLNTELLESTPPQIKSVAMIGLSVAAILVQTVQAITGMASDMQWLVNVIFGILILGIGWLLSDKFKTIAKTERDVVVLISDLKKEFESYKEREAEKDTEYKLETERRFNQLTVVHSTSINPLTQPISEMNEILRNLVAQTDRLHKDLKQKIS